MEPPPPGAHEGERSRSQRASTGSSGIGLGVVVGLLLGVAVAATTLLVLTLVNQQPARSSSVTTTPLNPVFQSPRPVVLPSNPPVPTVAPSVTSTSPLDGATNVPADADITITFASDMDQATLNATTVSVFDGVRGKNVAAGLEFTYRSDAQQLTMSLPPGQTWGSGNTIDVEITTGATDAQGAALAAPFRMTFSTR